MFLSEPPATRYDLSFSLFGFPVRVHPAFFLMPLILGGSVLRYSPISAGLTLLVLIGVFFVSILVHELGHAFAFRYFGQSSRVVLYWMGGLAIPDSGKAPWMPAKNTLNPQQQIIVSLAGPIFGFLLAALLIGLVLAIGGSVDFEMKGLMPQFNPFLPDSLRVGAMGTALQMFAWLAIWVNIFLNILNLAPVYPLDGGQVARQLFVVNDPWNGLKYSVFLSIAVGVLIALFSLRSGDQFIGIFFGFMAWSNYTDLQQMGGGGFGGRPW
jgi:Zn-dependent protease